MRPWAAGPRLVKQAFEAAVDELRATPQDPPFAWPDRWLARRHDAITCTSPPEQRSMLLARRASAWSSWFDGADREATAPRGVSAARRRNWSKPSNSTLTDGTTLTSMSPSSWTKHRRPATSYHRPILSIGFITQDTSWSQSKERRLRAYRKDVPRTSPLCS